MQAHHRLAKYARLVHTARHLHGKKQIATLKHVQVCVEMDFAQKDLLRLLNAHMEHILINSININKRLALSVLLVNTVLQAASIRYCVQAEPCSPIQGLDT